MEHYEIVKLLQDKGAEVNHRDKVSYCNHISLACTCTR